MPIDKQNIHPDKGLNYEGETARLYTLLREIGLVEVISFNFHGKPAPASVPVHVCLIARTGLHNVTPSRNPPRVRLGLPVT